MRKIGCIFVKSIQKIYGIYYYYIFFGVKLQKKTIIMADQISMTLIAIKIEDIEQRQPPKLL